MDKDISSYSVRIVGSFELPEGIDMQDYRIALDGSVVSEKLKDNQDGTYEKEYGFKPLTGAILTQLGKTIVMHDKRRDSVKLRTMIEGLRREMYPNEDEEVFYAAFQAYIRSKFDDLAGGFHI